MIRNKELIREYKPGDESKITKMHNDIFGTNRTLERWNWQFRGHVQGKDWIALTEVNYNTNVYNQIINESKDYIEQICKQVYYIEEDIYQDRKTIALNSSFAAFLNMDKQLET